LTNIDLVNKYANEIPREAKSVIRALDDDIRLAIVVALMKHDNQSFSELKKLFDINSSSLSYHLSLLQDGNLVRNFIELKEDMRSYYSITDWTMSILESLLSIISNQVDPSNNSIQSIHVSKLAMMRSRYRTAVHPDASLDVKSKTREISGAPTMATLEGTNRI